MVRTDYKKYAERIGYPPASEWKPFGIRFATYGVRKNLPKEYFENYGDSQKGIIALEYAEKDKVFSAKYGTYGEFRKMAKNGVPDLLFNGAKLKFSKNFAMGENGDWEGINYWIIAEGCDGGPDLTFFVFVKEGGRYGGRVIPTKKISQYFNLYEPFLRKKR